MCFIHQMTNIPLLSHPNSYFYFISDTFTDFTTSQNVQIELAGKISTSFGYDEIKAELTSNLILNSLNVNTFIVVATMRIERYVSSLKEEISLMSKDTTSLLDKQDYVGFFKTCGSSYVKSIRRAQEITSIFKFKSPSIDLAQEFAAKVNALTQGSNTDSTFTTQSKFISITSSLNIKTLAFGLGLNKDGSSSLTSTSLEQYNNVMMFSFKSFTQTEDIGNVGMVSAIEVVPWVDNPEFINASKLLDQNIELPLPRSLIPKASPISDDANVVFTNNESIRSQFKCQNSLYRIDKYGYCCEEEDLFNNALQQYEKEEQNVAVSYCVCKPRRKLDKSVMKNNISNNGEFVVRMDAIMQNKIHQLFTLQSCLDSVNSLSEKYDDYVLKSKDSAKYDASIEGRFTARELKLVLDPFNDYSLVEHMNNELDEFTEMFYRPCIAALFGTNIGSLPDIEPQYFMAYSWVTHDACSKISCLADNMRWNRDGSGCVESLISGYKAPLYNTNDNECQKDDESFPIDGSEVCKYNRSDLHNYHESVNACWGDQTVPHYLMDYFCMPEILGQKVEKNQQILPSHTCERLQRNLYERSFLLDDFTDVTTIVNPPTDYVLRFTFHHLGPPCCDPLPVSNAVLILSTMNERDYFSHTVDGQRVIMIFYKPETNNLLFVNSTSDNPNEFTNVVDAPLPLNEDVEILLQVTGTNRKVYYDDVLVSDTEIGTRTQFDQINVYMGNAGETEVSLYPSFNATLSDVFFAQDLEAENLLSLLT